MSSTTKMKIEVWSDVMCPFCYIGKRNYEGALKQFDDSNNIEIIWKSFQLDPSIPEKTNPNESVYEYLAKRKRMSIEQAKSLHTSVEETAKKAGLEFNFEKAKIVNSLKAHRVIQFSKTKGLGNEMEEVLFKAYFTDGKDIANQETLISLGESIGLKQSDIIEALQNDEYAILVQKDIQEAQQLRVTGVPFFVFDRKYAISGAQPTEVFLQTLKQSFTEWKNTNQPSQLNINNGPICTPEGECQ